MSIDKFEAIVLFISVPEFYGLVWLCCRCCRQKFLYSSVLFTFRDACLEDLNLQIKVPEQFCACESIKILLPLEALLGPFLKHSFLESACRIKVKFLADENFVLIRVY